MKFSFLKSGKKDKENTREKKSVIKIERTKNTPEVFFDRANSILKISGSSYPEDATSVYFPIIEWLNELVEVNLTSFTCEFNFNFLSSSSHKMVYELLMKLEDLHADGTDVGVVWYYEESDEDIMDAGEDFARILSIPIKMVEIDD